MPVYEFTWRIEVSSDEAAREILKSMTAVRNAAKSMLPGVPGDVSLKLMKLLETKGEENVA